MSDHIGSLKPDPKNARRHTPRNVGMIVSALHDVGAARSIVIKDNATFAPLGVSYHWGHEPIFYGWMPNGAHRWLGDRKQTTVWEIARPTKSPEHPTMKPVELVARAIEHSLPRGDIVLDLFLGSGTTMIAAEQLGRVCYGLELDPRYCDVIVRRFEAFTGATAVLLTDDAKAVS
jgi:DNA modification methylase